MALKKAKSLLLVLLTPSFALADGLTSILDNTVDYLQSGFVRSLAVLAVVGVGFGFMSGRLDKAKAVMLVLGVGMIMAAPSIINAIWPS